MANKNTERANKHNKEYTKQFVFRFRLDEDRDVIKQLESVSSKIGYVRQLILKDISSGDETMIQDYQESLEGRGFQSTNTEKKG